ncbi:MAG: hypothetical protein IJ193_05325 [Bacilli bacterium]|nr:hypothetical protein [Bacilli bacterium]
MNDSSESMFTYFIRQKLNDGEDISSSYIREAFTHGGNMTRQFCDASREEWKKVHRGLKKSILLDRLKGAKKVDDLVYLVDCAKDLKEQSFANYQTLLDYCEYHSTRASMDGLRVFFAYKDYCDSFDQLSTKFSHDILTRSSNRALVPLLLDMEDEKEAITSSNKDLVDHVQQIVTHYKSEDKSKRLIK